MSQRDSGYVRKERDAYETPEWVTDVLLPHIPAYVKSIWEPACGTGKMSGVLDDAGFQVRCSDITTGWDFLSEIPMNITPMEAIITNPPYEFALQFIDRALDEAQFVAMLLRTDYDHAKTRARLFTEPRFAKKIVLTRRIKWFEGTKGSPSFNHAWFIWDARHRGPPILTYDHMVLDATKEA